MERFAQFEWSPGFALVQKRKNIEALHDAAMEQLATAPLLEISTKSPRALGARLSAFNLHVPSIHLNRRIPLEAAFQGSKVYAGSGQHREIYETRSGTEAKKASRQYEDEALVAFEFEDKRFPLEPLTAFYDWLYLRALLELEDQRPSLLAELAEFQGFTDIEFNPKRSLNCQARSCALFVALNSVASVGELARDPELFIEALKDREYGMPSGPLTLE